MNQTFSGNKYRTTTNLQI